MKRRISLKAIGRLIDELKSIRDLLPSAFVSFSGDDEDDDQIEAGRIESSEVEVSLSAVISTMSEVCNLSNEPSNLSELMEVLFSPDDDLVGMCFNLEDAVNGYFGELFGEDLNAASDYLRDIIDELERRRDKWKARIESNPRLIPE